MHVHKADKKEALATKSIYTNNKGTKEYTNNKGIVNDTQILVVTLNFILGVTSHFFLKKIMYYMYYLFVILKQLLLLFYIWVFVLLKRLCFL